MRNQASEESVNHIASDRTSYIIGMSAVLLALYPFKDSLDNFSVTVFGTDLSLFLIGLIFLALLLVSAYLYGLNSIRYSIPLALEWEWLKYLELLAIVFYVIAFLFPLVLLLITLISFLITQTPKFQEYFLIIENVTSSLSIIVSMMAAVFFSFKLYTGKIQRAIEDLQETSFKLEFETDASTFDKNLDLAASIFRLYLAFVDELKAHLIVDIGIQAKNLRDTDAIRLAQQKKILRTEELSMVENLYRLRNDVAHKEGIDELRERDVLRMKTQIKQILTRLRRVRLSSMAN